MWRAFFLACGISLVIIGAQCLIVERVVLAHGNSQAQSQNSEYLFGGQSTSTAGGKKDIIPPDWAPWSLMAAGAVVMIYSFTIPKRVSG